MITSSHYLDDLEHKTTKAPRFYSATGYGRKIPTQHLVRLPGSRRWRRVYCCCYSNAGTCYVPDKAGNWTVIN